MATIEVNLQKVVDAKSNIKNAIKTKLGQDTSVETYPIDSASISTYHTYIASIPILSAVYLKGSYGAGVKSMYATCTNNSVINATGGTVAQGTQFTLNNYIVMCPNNSVFSIVNTPIDGGSVSFISDERINDEYITDQDGEIRARFSGNYRDWGNITPQSEGMYQDGSASRTFESIYESATEQITVSGNTTYSKDLTIKSDVTIGGLSGSDVHIDYDSEDTDGVFTINFNTPLTFNTGDTLYLWVHMSGTLVTYGTQRETEAIDVDGYIKLTNVHGSTISTLNLVADDGNDNKLPLSDNGTDNCLLGLTLDDCSIIQKTSSSHWYYNELQ